MSKNLRGFTLTELSIALVIIGLIVAAITATNSVKAKSKLRALIIELETYRTAFDEFKDRYQAVPGDMLNATDYWSGATNGNGNGYYNSTTEQGAAWHQLGLSCSGILKEKYTGAIPLTAGISLGASIAINGGFFSYGSPGANIYGYTNPYTNLLEFTSNSASLTPQQAQFIDLKIDDGQPDKGRLFVLRISALTATASKCVGNPYTSASAGGYVFSDTTPSCRVYYWLEKSFTNL
jgi:prepilin-type N-terminal cleavage/methylation domain-containing protein